MFKHIGQFGNEKVYLIAHNGSGFDNYFIKRNKNMILDKAPLKTSRGILSASIKNPYTSSTTSNKLR